MDEDELRAAAAARMLTEHDMISVRMLIQGEITEPTILFVHQAKYCQGREFGCVIHGASDHHMREMELVWDPAGHFMTRMCEHGQLHVDPDDAAFRESTWNGRFMGGHTVTAESLGNAVNLRAAMMTHKCTCKCCIKETANE